MLGIEQELSIDQRHTDTAGLKDEASHQPQRNSVMEAWKKEKLIYNYILTKDPMFSKCNKEARSI